MSIYNKEGLNHIWIRPVRSSEGDAATSIEHACFPPNEACSREHMWERVEQASDLFLAAEDRATGKMVGFLTGVATEGTAFRDEFFTDISLHNPKGKTVLMLSLAVLPAYQHRGIARALTAGYLDMLREQGRNLVLLTCVEEKVKMYQSFGFRDLGIANSSWGGEQWHEMSIILGDMK